MCKFLSLERTTSAQLEEIKSAFHEVALENSSIYLKTGTAGVDRKKKLETAAEKFTERVFNRIKEKFFNTHARKRFCFSCEFGEEENDAADLMSYGVMPLIREYANSVFSTSVLLAWLKIQDDYIPDFTGKTETTTDTDAMGTSEDGSNGKTWQAFNSGITSTSTGTSTLTNAQENRSGMTTGKTTSKTSQGYAHEYAGDVGAFAEINARLSANMVETTANKFFVCLIPRDALFAWEILD